MKLKEVTQLRADCENCFGLCCAALPFGKSADFPCNKDGGEPCSNLQKDYRCSIHGDLRENGYKGCTVFECFGAGQKVSQFTFAGESWRETPEKAEMMFKVFPVMHQLHEMLWYLNEALSIEACREIHADLLNMSKETEALTLEDPEDILRIDVVLHRFRVNELLVRAGEQVRKEALEIYHLNPKKKMNFRSADLMGKNLKTSDFRGANFRGAYLIAADLRDSDFRMAEMIGADMRDADVRGADFSKSLFLTQVQINAAKGDSKTKLPPGIKYPLHWS